MLREDAGPTFRCSGYTAIVVAWIACRDSTRNQTCQNTIPKIFHDYVDVIKCSQFKAP